MGFMSGEGVVNGKGVVEGVSVMNDMGTDSNMEVAAGMNVGNGGDIAAVSTKPTTNHGIYPTASSTTHSAVTPTTTRPTPIKSTPKNEITLKVGNRIRQLRKQKNWSQETLALEAELNAAFLGHLERGLKCPTVETLSKIAQAFKMNLSEFLDFEEAKYEVNETTLATISRAIRKLSPEKVEKITKIVEDIVSVLE